MANETGQSAISNLYAAEIVSREVAESLTASTGVVSFVWIEQAEGSKVVKFGKSAAMTAASYTDTTGMSLTEYDPTSTSVTVAAIGIASRITGFASALRPDTLVRVGQEQGKAVAVKADTDITALFPSVSASVNRASATLRMTDWLSAIYTLNAANVPDSDRIGVVSAKQYSDLTSDSQTTNQFAFQQYAQTGKLAAPFGVPVFLSTTCTTANSAVDSVGCMFHRQAFGFGSLRGVNVEVLRAPAQYNATDVATTVYYGVALIDANRAVKLISKATA